MSRWFRRVTENKNDLSPVVDALEHFHREYEDGVPHLKVKGREITQVAAEIPGFVEYYNARLFEVDAILKYFEQLVDEAEVAKTMWYMSHYNRQLSESTAKRYAEVHPDVMELKKIVGEIAMVRNLFTSLTKGLEVLHYQIKNVTALRSAGFEDSQF